MSLFAVPARETQFSRGLKRNTGASGSDKPVWPLEVIEDVILECARERAAISQGQILVATETGLAPLPWQPGVERENNFAMGNAMSSHWRCVRHDAEPWDAYVARSTAHAIESVRSLVGAARYAGDAPLYVDLAWVTEDEPALFELPGFQRTRLDQAIATGAPYSFRGTAMHVALAKPAPGSFYGVPSADVSTIPADARCAWVSMRAKHLRRLATLDRLEVLHIDSPTEKTECLLEMLPQLRALSIDTIRPKRLPRWERLENLELMAVATWRQPGDLSALASLRRLRVLEASELGVTSLDFLSALDTLRGLHLTVRRPVTTLAPLAGLQNLLRLRFWGGTEDGSLRPLASLHGLQSLVVRTSSFALEEFAALAVALPNTEGEHRAPFRDAMGWQTQLLGCKRCGKPATHYTLGKPSRMMCDRCDGALIAKHVAQWEILVSAARARQSELRTG